MPRRVPAIPAAPALGGHNEVRSELPTYVRRMAPCQ